MSYQKHQDRLSLFKRFGCDVEQEREAVIEQAQSINEPILEVGTGKGYFTLALARKEFLFVSMDISEEEQDFTRQNLQAAGLQEQVDLKVCCVDKLYLADASISTIFSINALHHFCNPFQVVDEMARVTNDTGKIIISDFSSKGFRLVSEIYESEGMKHGQGEVRVNDVAGYLMKKGWGVQKHRTVFQETIVACQKKAKRI